MNHFPIILSPQHPGSLCPYSSPLAHGSFKKQAAFNVIMSKQILVETSEALQSESSSTATQPKNATKPAYHPSSSMKKPHKPSHLIVPIPSSQTHHSSHSIPRPTQSVPPPTPLSQSAVLKSIPLEPTTTPPTRLLSLHPSSPFPSPNHSNSHPLSASEADYLCSEICSLIWFINLGDMLDKVIAADRRGQVDDKLYSQLLDFFYCFVPMVVVAPRSDPVVTRKGDLASHRRIINTFGLGWDLSSERGPHRRHRWDYRPRSSPGGLVDFLLGHFGRADVM